MKAPGVIGAGELVTGIAGARTAYLHATMRAAVVQHADCAFRVAGAGFATHHHHRLTADLEGVVIAQLRNLRLVSAVLPGFLEDVLFFAHEAGALLVFDETITGFRYARGGAQEIFGVIPDLSTFGKGIANGFPLSAVVGRRDVMMEMEEIFFSGTFGGELLSLTAAKVVLQRHLAEDVCGKLDLEGQPARFHLDPPRSSELPITSQ